MTTSPPPDAPAQPLDVDAQTRSAFVDRDIAPIPRDLAVSVRHLSHTYPPVRERRRKGKHAAPDLDRTALNTVSLSVKPGEVFGLLGPNGSGKSTLFRILATVQAATPPAGVDAGSADVFGTDIANDPARVRSQIGVVFQHPSLDDKLTAFENLRYHGMLHGMTGRMLRDRCDAALKQAGLADRSGDRVAAFSGGMRRRVEIAKALLTRPRLLLMDEASTGLDPAAQQALWRTLRTQVADHGLTVLLTTHLMHEAEQCDRLAVLDRGQVVAVDTTQALIDRVGGQLLEVVWAPMPHEEFATAEQQLAEHLGLASDDAAIQRFDGGVRLEIEDAAAAVPGVADLLGDRAGSIRVARPTLEDAYLKLTGSALAG